MCNCVMINSQEEPLASLSGSSGCFFDEKLLAELIFR